MNVIDWIAVVLLVLSLVKVCVGLFAPSALKKLRTNLVVKNYKKAKFIIFPVWAILGLITVFFSLKSVSVSEFVVSGYGFLMLIFLLMFSRENVLKSMIVSMTKESDSWWQFICGIWLIVAITLLYFILFS